jgi:hypothetical protein
VFCFSIRGLGALVRAVAGCFLCVAVFLLAGCTIWQKETTNRGGYLDYILDQHWIQADSKRMRAMRAFAIEVSLARIASVSAKNQADRNVLATRIGMVTKQFWPVYNCAIINDVATNKPGTESGPCFFYDSAMVEYTTGLFDLAVMALPVEDAKNLINAIPTSAVTPIAWADLLNALLVIGRDAITLGRVAGALYRDTVELEVQLWLATPAVDVRAPPYNVTEADVAPLRAVYAQGNDNMPAWFTAMTALRNRGLEPYPDPRFFDKLDGLIKYMCGQITSDSAFLSSCQGTWPPTPATKVSSLFTGALRLAGPAKPATMIIGQTSTAPHL